MGDTAFVKLKDGNELDRAPILPEEVDSEFAEGGAQIPDRIPLDLGRVKC
jgi:hypothetical protein